MSFTTKKNITKTIDEVLMGMPSHLFDIGGGKICQDWTDNYTKHFVLNNIDYETKIKMMEQIIIRLHNVVLRDIKNSKETEACEKNE